MGLEFILLISLKYEIIDEWNIKFDFFLKLYVYDSDVWMISLKLFQPSKIKEIKNSAWYKGR